MEIFKYLLVGGGLASSSCAETLIKENASGAIGMFCMENFPPYHRPPLSKGLLLGYSSENDIWIHSSEFYLDNKINLMLNNRINKVDAEENIVIDANNNKYGFEKLLIATGCAVKQIPLDGSKLKNVFYLRTLDDEHQIKEAMRYASTAVIIGAGFIGMELASAFAQNGIKTTMVVRENTIFEKMGSPEMSLFFLNYYKEQGVEIILNDQASRIEGNDRAENVVTVSGAEIPADIVAIGIGVYPNVDFLEGSGIEVNNGVLVNEHLESVNRKGVFAAGDVANYDDLVFGKRHRLEHWDNARKQGELAAKNMMGQQTPVHSVPYFYSEMFDISWEFIGDNTDVDETLLRGSFETQYAVLFFLKDKTLKAAFLMMSTQAERNLCEKLIINRTSLSNFEDQLVNVSIPLNRLFEKAA